MQPVCRLTLCWNAVWCGQCLATHCKVCMLPVLKPQYIWTIARSYYVEKGFWVAITARITNLVAIGFTAVFTGFLALWVDWAALDSECLHNDTCDILDVSPSCFSFLHAQMTRSLTAETVPLSVAYSRIQRHAIALSPVLQCWYHPALVMTGCMVDWL